MPNKTPLQDKSIQGGNTSTISRIGYLGNIPPAAVQALENEAAGLIHGTIMLTLHVKDGHLIRYVIGKEHSFIPGKPTTGG
ncbi:MAG: hypothetical protein LBH43_20550 [Treponema sp.]|jgi:hypothetical protein|nr:hypothetical protein [Treponema sp.]